MGHDIHFLTRLERIQEREVELALTLYNHPDLLRATLDRAKLPDNVWRVAISLDHPTEGPFVVVTRDGHFVTCLARGMVPTGRHVITRAQLDAAAREVQRMREKLAQLEYFDANTGLFVKQFRTVLDGAGHVSREQIETVSRWVPIFGSALLPLLAEAIESFDTVRRAACQRENRGDTELLRAYRDRAYAIGHVYVLCGENAEGRDRFAEVAANVRTRCSFSLAGTLTDVSGVALRASWAAGRWGKALLRMQKDALRETESPLEIDDATMALAAIGHAHRKLRAEAYKALPASDEGTYCVEAARASFDREAEMDRRALARGRDLSVELARSIPALPRYEHAADVPEDVARAMLLHVDRPVVANRAHLEQAPELLPWLGRARGPELYLPESIVRALETPWDPREAMAMVDRMRLFSAPQPVRAAARPGRNERCPCASGKKFKRCCLRAA